MKPKLLIITTVHNTLRTILVGQPKFLSQYFEVSLASASSPELSDISDREGVETHAVEMRRGISPLHDIMSIINMVRLIRKLKPDIIQSYTPKAGMVSMVAGWITRVPVRVHTFTGLIFPSRSGLIRKILISIDKLIAKTATHVVPESQGVRADLIAAGIEKGPMQLIGSGNIAGVDTLHMSREAPGVSVEGTEIRAEMVPHNINFLFVFVGRLSQDKGLDELTAALTDMPKNAGLLVVGQIDHSARPSAYVLKRIAENPRIVQLGHLKDIRPILHIADILVLPSYREGFPNVLLEAAAMQVPAIATDISGCNELVEPGVNGWLVPVRNTIALSEAMLDAIGKSPAELKKWGGAARNIVVQNFERQAHLMRLNLFYHNLLEIEHGNEIFPKLHQNEVRVRDE